MPQRPPKLARAAAAVAAAAVAVVAAAAVADAAAAAAAALLLALIGPCNLPVPIQQQGVSGAPRASRGPRGPPQQQRLPIIAAGAVDI